MENLQLKTTITKNVIGKLEVKMEEKICEQSDRTIEITQSEQQTTNRLKKKNQRSLELEGLSQTI